MTEPITEHALYDFSQLPLTNEQEILACLRRIEVLTIRLVDASSWTDRSPSHLDQIAKTPTRDEQIAALAAAKPPANKGRFGGRK